jgi:FkbM family methyltransferase
MTRLLDRAKVYCLYFYEFIRFAEFDSAINGALYALTRKSYSSGKRINSRLGAFETRRGTLDFVYVNYAYEVDLKHFIEAHPFDVFFDVGACIGEYSVWLARKGYRCFAFEPIQSSYEILTKNIALNGLQNKITAFNYGLGDKASIEHFKLHAINPGANRRVDRETEHTTKAEIKTLDNIYQTLNLDPSANILVKIDVEGMEVAMLKGAQNFLKHFNNVTLIIEEKISGSQKIMDTLNAFGTFQYGVVDDYNMYAKKVESYQNRTAERASSMAQAGI